jgi:hypothetical protein
MEVVGTMVKPLAAYDIIFQYQNPNSFFSTLKYIVPADNDICIDKIQFTYCTDVVECKVKSREKAFEEDKRLEQEGCQTKFAECGLPGKIEVRAANVPPHEIIRMPMKVLTFV